MIGKLNDKGRSLYPKRDEVMSDREIRKRSNRSSNVSRSSQSIFGISKMFVIILLQTTFYATGNFALQTNLNTQCPEKCQCTEPIENITCSNLLTLPGFPATTKSLTLIKCQVSTLFNDSFANLTLLETLTLNSDSVRINTNAFNGLTRLRSLTIYDTTVHFDNKADVFEPLQNITTLVLRNIGLNAPIPRLGNVQGNAYVSDLKIIVTHLRSIEYLDVSHNLLGYSEAEMQEHFLNLKVLKIQHNNFDSFDTGLLGYNKSFKLEELDISDTFRNFYPTKYLEGLKHFKKLKILYLNGNTIKNLKDDTFSQFKSIEQLSLVDCHIENSSIRAFASLSNLTSLDVSNNPALNLTQVSRMLFGLTNSKIMNLTIQKSSFKELNSSLLQYAKGTKQFKMLDLSSGAITIVKAKSFSQHQTLTYLDLSHNKITKIEQNAFQNLEKLETLKLDGNKLVSLHKYIFSTLASLRSLTISNNLIRVVDEAVLTDQKELITLSLQENVISTLPDKIFQSLSQLRFLDLKQATSRSPSDHTSWPRVLGSLYSLRTLNLMDNDIVDIPFGSFNALSNITQLDLRRNKISHLDDHVFESISNVKQLILHGNQFESLNRSGIAKLTSLKELDISLNPFHCDCNMAWFSDWYIHSNVTLFNVSITHCTSPESRVGFLLVEYSPSLEECPLAQQLRNNTGFYVGIAVAVVGVVIILSILAWAYRGSIRTTIQRYVQVNTGAPPTPSFPGETIALTSNESEA
ncbi:unnamed protein product [Owenia fusiformis]|uniref:Uncharacterized protein n=1 Tax=Owenia fusiformis TaxID=6347 RepID=A0A8J1XJD0_OWEFU|nr:unnamed protein product [Owenia fusiformis]